MNNSQEIRDFLNLSSSTSLAININNDDSFESSPVESETTSPILMPNIDSVSKTSKSSIKHKLLNNSQEYILVPCRGKSEVWKSFQLVMHVKSTDIDDLYMLQPIL